MRRIAFLVALIALTIVLAVPSLGTQAQGGGTYTVQPGDHLYRIALKFGVTVAAIQQANNISNPDLIFPGEVLTIPAGGTVVTPATSTPSGTSVATTPTPVPASGTTGTYTVQPGDTLSSIAGKFGTTYLAIAQANGITNPNLIFVGQVLNIPGGTGGSSNPAPTASSGGNASGPAPLNLSGFELGGQVVSDISPTVDAVMKSAHMKWVKRQIAAGDGNGPNWISQAHSAGYKILLSVIGEKAQVTNSAYQDSYASYVGSMARSGADAIEVWNEMNIDREWPTGQISPTSYVSLLSKSYSAIKAANANTIVISGALAPTGAEGAFGLASVWNDDRYYNGMAAAGAGRYADCIGVHYNEGIVSPNQVSGDPRDNYPTRYFSTMLTRAIGQFPGKMACFTELGYLTPQGYSALPGGFSWAGNTTIAQQAQWLGQAVTKAIGSGRVRLLIVFNVNSTNYGTDPQAGYAIVRADNSCPACATLAAAAQ